MSQVPFFDIARYAHEAGFRGEPHAIVVALAQPESSRIASAHNGSDPNKGSFGLLQINGVHLEPTGTLFGWTTDDLYDPAKNLKAAFLVWQANGESFEPWGAFVNDLHKPSMDAAKVALDGLSRWRTAEIRAGLFKSRADSLAVEVTMLTQNVDRLNRLVDERDAEIIRLSGLLSAANGKIDRARAVLA
jgi:hypothetical protein